MISADISLSGPVSTDYVITVKAESGNVVKKSDSASFILKLKNPCIDPNYVSIQKAVLQDQRYELYEFDPTGFVFTHVPFTVVTQPF